MVLLVGFLPLKPVAARSFAGSPGRRLKSLGVQIVLDDLGLGAGARSADLASGKRNRTRALSNLIWRRELAGGLVLTRQIRRDPFKHVGRRNPRHAARAGTAGRHDGVDESRIGQNRRRAE